MLVNFRQGNQIRIWLKRFGFLLVAWCGLVSWILYGWLKPKNTFDTPLVAPASVPTQLIIAKSKEFTENWITGDFSTMSQSLSPECDAASLYKSKKWKIFLNRQRLALLKANPKSTATNYHLISPSYGFYAMFFIVSLDCSQFKKRLFAMELLPDRAATVQFDINGKHFDQIWIREKDSSWKSIAFPLDMDNLTVKSVTKM